MLVKVTQEQEKVHSENSKRSSCTICEMMKTSSLLCTSPAAKFKNFLKIYKQLSFPILLQKKMTSPFGKQFKNQNLAMAFLTKKLHTIFRVREGYRKDIHS